ncbi:hypothetical protein [uncultured Winogradskyella sp.]|uniref:hypothetical protein n=1 Tax=uncultured Winogradskyella sp. TaxID=395353 RepID=UPI0030D984B9
MKHIHKIDSLFLRLGHSYVIFYKIPSKGIPKIVVTSKRVVWMSEVKQFVSETERY